MLTVIKTKNWRFYWGTFELPKGAEAVGLVTPDKRPTGVLLRLADGKYWQGNAGELNPLPQEAVEKALAAAKAADTLAKIQTKTNPARVAASRYGRNGSPPY
jgi:hypothetical protein